MARYDRIAPLSAPSRESAFPAWLVLRDIDGNDRDSEVARRARLRFLALRPVLRLLARGMDGVSRESYLAQIEAVREELGYLPSRDVERARLARFLHQVEEREPVRIITAALEMAEACAAAGQTYGAEEYALTALGIAAANGEGRLHGAASTSMSRIHRSRGELAEAEAYANAALTTAQRFDARIDVVYARAELALAAAQRGDRAGALAMLEQTVREMRSAGDAQAEALAAARLCACLLLLEEPAAALEHGWAALRQLDDLRERATLLDLVGTALARLGLHKAAERCFSMVAQRGVDPALRARARAGQAVAAAAAGSLTVFRERRAALLNDAAEWSADPRVAALVNLELGRGCVVAGDVDFARDHLRDAISLARRLSLADVLQQAEDVLTALEQNSTSDLVGIAASGPAADTVRKIADQVEALLDLSLVPSIS